MYEGDAQDVTFRRFPDLGELQFDVGDTNNNNPGVPELITRTKTDTEEYDNQELGESRQKLFKVSHDYPEVHLDCEAVENTNSYRNVFDLIEVPRIINPGYICLDTYSHMENNQDLGRIIFLDLDNTLIPTSWIMQVWRTIQFELGNDIDSIDYDESDNRHLYELTKQIREKLIQVGLFDILEKFFSDLLNVGKAFKIVIVTNAGIRTVDFFYLKYCLPKLCELLGRFNIEIKSTEDYIRKKGHPPSPFKEEEYREFYTDAKLNEFQKVLLGCWTDTAYRARGGIPNVFDVISVGDQACEMTAACRICKFYENKIRYTKLLYVYDPDDFRFWRQSPESFILQLSETHKELLNILSNDSETFISCTINKPTESATSGQRNETFEDVALGWHNMGRYINIAISKPGRFLLPEDICKNYCEAEREYFENRHNIAL